MPACFVITFRREDKIRDIEVKEGALIVIEKSVPLNDIIRTGEIINANVNQRLIENTFSCFGLW